MKKQYNMEKQKFNFLLKSKILFGFLLFLGLSANVLGQTPTVLFTGLSSTSPAQVNNRFTLSTMSGVFKQVRFQSLQSAGPSSLGWAFHGGSPGAPDYSQNWRPYTSGNTMSVNNYIPVGFANGARYNTGGGQDGLLPAITSGNYYTFNVSNNASADNVMQLLETTFNPVAISTVTFTTPANTNNGSVVTVTTASAPAAGENVFVRYSFDGYVTSTLAQVTFVGTTGTALIPCRGSAGTVSFYVYSSNKTAAQINTDVTGNGQTAHDMATLNLNNGGGSNYSYTQGIGTSFAGTFVVPSTCYPTLASFVTALNGATIAGPVTCILANGYTETAPAGGYNITATGTVTNTITIQGFSTAARNVITAPTTQVSGTLTDAIFKLVGADYITIQNFDMRENAANTTTAAGTNNMTEFGVALFYATATNGAQNNTIQNNTITLNRTYQNTFGIYSNSTHTATSATVAASATSAAGGNSGLKIYGNAISNVNQGISIVGPTAAADLNTGVDIGGTSLNQGNSITNWGTTGAFSGYANVSGTLNGILVRNCAGYNISYNTVTSSAGGNTVTASQRAIFVPSFSAAPTTAVTCTINNNNISVQSGITTGTVNGIIVEATTGSATSSLTINSNNFSSMGHTVASPSGAHAYISNSMAHLNTTISSNTFTNLAPTTTGNVTFIANAIAVPAASGSMNINSNSIVTAFNKTGAGGTVTFYTSNASSLTGSTINFQNNNISNITVSGAAGFVGINNTDGGSPTKTITGNTFNNISGGTGAINPITINFMGATSSVSNNTVSNITWGAACTGITIGASSGAATTLNVSNNTVSNITLSAGAVTGITVGSPLNTTTLNVNGNTISGLSSTAGVAVQGLLVTGAATPANIFSNTIFNLSGSNAGATIVGMGVSAGANPNIYANKMYDFSVSGASTAVPAVTGLLLSGSTSITVQAYNNLIGDLRAATANSADAIRGIAVTASATSSNYRLYNNTIYLNASSSGAAFGTTGIFHTANATATTAALDLRNNMVFNTSTPNGAGVATALRRSAAATLGNYASTSNNNLYFAGTPSATRTIMTDGTNFYQTMATFQTAVAPTREAASFSETTFVPGTYFTSTAGANANYLKPTAGLTTQAESGGQTIALTSPDYGAVVRPASPGTNFDCGAWEFAGISPAPAITLTSVTPATTTQCTKTARVVVVSITTPAGTISGANINYNHNGTPQTAIVMTNTSGSTWAGTMLAPTVGNATVTWTVVATNSIGISTTYTGTSFADEPLTGLTATATATPSPVCTGGPTSLSVSFSAGALPTGYTTTGLGGGSTPYISSFTLNTINYSAAVNATSPFYKAMPATGANTTTLAPGQSYVSSLTANSTGIASIWIDFNRNGVFEASEWFQPYTTGTTGSVTVVVPANAPYGLTMMRIRTRNTTPNGSGDANTNFASGEAIDFTVNIMPTITAISWSDGSGVVGTTNPLSQSPSVNTNYTATATATGCPLVSNTVAVTVTALPSAPTANVATSTQCGAGVPTVSVSGTAGQMRWYDGNTSGALLLQTGGLTYTSAVTSTQTLYLAVNNGTCETAPANRTPLTVTVTTADALTASVAPTGNICLGAPIDLSVAQTGSTQTYALTWTASPAAGSGIPTSTAGSLSSATTVTPTSAGTYIYTITGVDGICSNISTVSVTVINPNAGLSITALAAPSTICAGTPTSLAVNITSTPATYCTVAAATSTSSYFDMFSTTGGTTNITNSASGFSTAGYGNFTNLSVRADRNTVINFNTTLTGTTVGVAIWVDWNQNGTFETIERMFVTSGYVLTAASSFTVPVTALYGTTRMRILMDFNSTAPANPCGPFVSGRGEVEDYTFVVGPIPSAYSWSDGSSIVGTTNPLSQSPSATTTYTCTATINSCPVVSNGALVTVNSVPSDPTVSISSQCGSAVPTCSATGGSAGQYRWYTVATGGTPIAGENNATLSAYVVSASTTLYVSINNGNCESARIPVAITVTPAPAFALSTSTGVNCSGVASSTTVTITTGTGDYDTYTWLTNPSTVSGSSTLGWEFNPTVSTVYTLIASQSMGVCSNSATVSITTTPPSVGGVATASIATICNSGTSVLSLAGNTGTIQWQVSTDNLAWADVPSGGTASSYTTPTLTATTYYRANVTNSICSSVQSNVLTIVVNTPTVTSTTPGSVCVSGPVTLAAVGSAGTTLNWYATASSTTALGTGTTFTTPTLTNSTNYFVEAALVSSTYNVGLANPAAGGTQGNQTVVWDINFTVLSATTLQSVVIYPVTTGQTGTFTVRVGNGFGGTVVGTVNYTTSASGGATPQTITFNVPLTPGNYSIYSDVLPTGGLRRNIAGAVYPYTSTVANITGNGFDATYFMGCYNWIFNSGCASPRTQVTATVNPNPNAFTITPTAANTCANTVNTLTASTTANPAYIIGTSSASSVAANTPYRQAVTTESRVQYLITAAELNAAGITGAVNLNSLGFNVTTAGTGTMGSYVIRMANTAATVLTTTYQTPTFTTVYTGTNILPVLGVNSYTFTTPFAWDGTSNIVVNICHSGSGGTASTVAVYTPSVLMTTSGSGTGQCGTATGVTNANKPVMYITTAINSPITWTTNVTGLFTDAGATTAYVNTNLGTVYSKPSSLGSYTYTATATYNGCTTNSTPINVTVQNVNNTTMTTAIGSALTSGDYVWNGNTSTSWETATNWYKYDGTNFLTSSTIPLNTDRVYVLTNTAVGTNCVSTLNPATVNVVVGSGVAKDVYIGTGATLLMDPAKNLSLDGNWTNNGTFTPNATASVTFNGTGAQAIRGTTTTTFTNLVVNKSAGLLTLNTAANVSGLLTMTAGDISTTSTNLLTVGISPAAPASLAWTSGSILGPIRRFFSGTASATQASGIFPVGLANNNRYAQINYTSGLSTGGSITAEYVAGIPSPLLDNGLPNMINGQLIQNYESEGYWSITPSGGDLNTATYSTTLRGNNLTTVLADIYLANLRLIKSTSHTTWDNNGLGTQSAIVGSASDFTITNVGMTGFSFFNIGAGDITPLPIKLLNFSASCNETSIDVSWTTATEQNSQSFIIERSRDLAIWEFVSEVTAAANSSSVLNYDALDTDPFSGVTYYRMKQVDLDGVVKIYGPISATCADIENNMIVFPNPTKGNFIVEISSAENISNAQIQITDLTGKIITERSTNILEGKNQFSFDGLDLQLGTYIINLNSGNGKINPVRVVVN